MKSDLLKPVLIPFFISVLTQAASELGERLMRETVARPSVAVTTVSLSRSSSLAAGTGTGQHAPTSETTNGYHSSFQSEVVAPLYTVLSKVCYACPAYATIHAACFLTLLFHPSMLLT